LTLKPVDKLPATPLKINRALLSVSDKTGLIPLVKILIKLKIELISTGGTATTIRKAGFQVKDISEITGFPECLGGRVKTLHPSVHGGILARTTYGPDLAELEKLGIKPIELVIVNLYPFIDTIRKKNVALETAIENIDIGGPTMIRAAAKNFAHVCIASSPSQYKKLESELKGKKSVSYELRKQFALEAFRHTAEYDSAIGDYLDTHAVELLPVQWNKSLTKSGTLRYGENPHQPAAVYGNQKEWFECLHGKELSYNNYLDIDSALHLMADFQGSDPTAAIFKHTVPCGVASDTNSLADAYRKAFSTDKVSPFGGIVITNKEIDLETARVIDEIFTEIILAPSFSNEALAFLKKKKNRRIVKILKFPSEISEPQFRSITGGALLQRADRNSSGENSFKTVTKRSPDDHEWEDLLFAWKIVKHVKSNAIVYVKDRQTVGIGTGQTSRVDSSEIAIRKAEKEGLSLKDSVVASDAFFPFADGLEAAARAGAKAVIQPGGSIRDQEVIEKADRLNLVMMFTGKRHFKH